MQSSLIHPVRAFLFAVFILVPGCERKQPQVVEPAKATPAAAPSAAEPSSARPSDADLRDLGEFLAKDQRVSDADSAAPAGELPPGHPPIPPGHPAVSEQEPMEEQGASATLHFDPPLDWKPEPVTSGFRLAQYALPRAEGDDRDGQMVVFFFGPGQGGPVDMNIARWKGMFTTADGKPVPDAEAKIGKREVNGLKVTTLDVSGMYEDPMAARSGAATIKGEARMLAAIVETPSGNYFLKAVGRSATIGANAASFDKMISTVRMSDGEKGE